MIVEILTQNDQDEEYGFFDTHETIIESKDETEMCPLLQSERSSQNTSQPAKKITIFSVNLTNVVLSCKSFETLASSNLQVSAAVNGFRIVQDPSGEYAEFKVKLCFNSRCWTFWRKTNDFRELHKVSILMSNRRCVRSSIIWNSICRRERWWRKNLSVKFSIWKTMKLGEFFKEFLFETPLPSILRIFSIDDDN